MLGVVWFLATVTGAFIYLMSSPLASVLNVAELAAASVPVGTIFSAWVVYAMAALTSSLSPATLIMANAIICAVVGLSFPRFWRNWRAVNSRGLGTDALDCAICGAVFVVLGALFWPLYSSRMIPFHDGKIWSGGSCWADLPIHMHIAESFLQGRNSDISWGGLASPVFAGEKMYYPFLPDFHAAVVKRLGGELRDGFLWAGWLMACALWVLLYSLSVRVTRSRLGALLAILITIGAGGMGGPSFIWNRGWAAALDVDTAQNDVTMGYKIFWFAFMPHVLLPQRGANYAYPMALLVLLLVWRATDMGLRVPMPVRRSLLVHASAFAAALPLVQAHSFIGLGLMIGAYFAMDAHKWLAHPGLAAAWAQAGVVAAVIGYPQIAFFQKQVAKGAGGKFITFGWIYKDNHFGREGGISGFVSFWWASLGPAVPLYLLTIAICMWDLAAAALHARALRSKGGDAQVADALEAFGVGVPTSAVPAWEEPRSAAGAVGGGASRSKAPSGRRRRGSNDDGGGDEGDDGWGVGPDAGLSNELMLGGPAAAGHNDDGEGSMHAAAAYGSSGARRRAPVSGGSDGGGDGLLLPGGVGRRSGTSRAVTTLGVHMRRLQEELGNAVASARSAAHATATAEAAARGGPGAKPSPTAVALHTLANLPAVLGAAFLKAAYASWSPGRGKRLMRILYGYDGPAPRSVGTHFMVALLDGVPDALADVIEGRVSLAVTSLDEIAAPLNALSLTGRSFDALKLSLSAGLVWAVGNYVNFQPWDRDNCKLFYLWVFVYSGFIGATLAAPFEFLIGAPSGYARLMAFVGAPFAEVLSLARASDRSVKGGTISGARSAGYVGGSSRVAGAGHGALAAALGGALRGGAGRKEKGDDDDGYVRRARDEDAPIAPATASTSSYFTTSSSSTKAPELSGTFTSRRVAARVLVGPAAVASAATLALMTVTGVLMVAREYGMNHVMFDEDAIAVGKWIEGNTHPGAVIMHRDHHIFSSGSLAGRPALLAYTGWMSSHGYNYFDRDRDRNHVLANVLRDSDQKTVDMLYKWGARYILGEWLPQHFRPSESEAEERAIARRTAASDAEREALPELQFDPDAFLDGHVRRVFRAGRFDVLQVTGYSGTVW